MTDQPEPTYTTPGDEVNADICPHTLRCEHRTTPFGIDEPAPRLSWELAAQGRDRRQAAYRILVVTHLEMLKGRTADL